MKLGYSTYIPMKKEVSREMRKLKRDEVKKKSFFSTHKYMHKKIHTEKQKKLRGFLWPLLLKSFSTYNAGYRDEFFFSSFFISVFSHHGEWDRDKGWMMCFIVSKKIFLPFVFLFHVWISIQMILSSCYIELSCVCCVYLYRATHLLTYLLIMLKLYRVNKKIEFRLQFDFYDCIIFISNVEKREEVEMKKFADNKMKF